ncbi:hypothetical protein Taro_013913 [Colocasia esculenta]|uniref:Uncharacterized protein n=1 Tax=Colocasia esculenta TaxID=4460 RepID=A0A843UK86_COLES|nr:hypothetical protein [Colocasia esculenta]
MMTNIPPPRCFPSAASTMAAPIRPSQPQEGRFGGHVISLPVQYNIRSILGIEVEDMDLLTLHNISSRSLVSESAACRVLLIRLYVETPSVRFLGISRYVEVLPVRLLGVSCYARMLLIRSPSILEFHQGLWSSPGKIPNALSAQRYRMESDVQTALTHCWGLLDEERRPRSRGIRGEKAGPSFNPSSSSSNPRRLNESKAQDLRTGWPDRPRSQGPSRHSTYRVLNATGHPVAIWLPDLTALSRSLNSPVAF